MFKKIRIILLFITLIALLMISSDKFFKSKEQEAIQETRQVTLTENEAINLVKQTYPELSEYPSDKLPPRVVLSEKAIDGWYLQFRQEGSGIPIIEAHCFLVKPGKDQIVKTGHFKAEGSVINTVAISNCK